jgi:hypothetical protein
VVLGGLVIIPRRGYVIILSTTFENWDLFDAESSSSSSGLVMTRLSVSTSTSNSCRICSPEFLKKVYTMNQGKTSRICNTV